MCVDQQIGEGAAEDQWDAEYLERVKLRKQFKELYDTR